MGGACYKTVFPCGANYVSVGDMSGSCAAEPHLDMDISLKASIQTRETGLKDMMTPEEPAVRRSSRTGRGLTPKRLQYSPDATENKPTKKRGSKRQAYRVIEEFPDSSEEECASGSSDEEWLPVKKSASREVTVKKTKAQVEKESLIEGPKDEKDAGNGDVERESGGLSAYELERLENIRQNQAFLSSINLLEATEELQQMVRRKPSQKGLRPQAVKKEVLPPRKSLRLQNIEAEMLKLPPEPTATLVFERSSSVKKPAGPLPMAPVNMEEGSKLPSQLFDLCSEETQETKMSLDLKEYGSAVKSMRLREDAVVKVVKDRIFSAAFHPCSSSLLMAAGDKWGRLGLLKVGSDWGDDGVLLFEPHTRPVACMAFSRADPTQLLSLSYDGSMRCMDIEKAVFEDVYDSEDGLRTFGFMSHDCSTLVVGNWYGEVAIVDRRTPGNSHESLHSLDSKTVRCVSVHPLQMQYFAVAEDREVNIYDSRCLKKTKSQAVFQLHGHSLSINSAYFSPCTGNRVLTSCMDNHIRVFDTSSMTSKSSLLTSIRHDMRTGRWLSKLSAVWDPKQEDCFVVGSMMRPRQVQVFQESGQRVHSFIDDDNLTTVLSVTAFHPTRNALLGGNASGRLHVFSS